jgi:hypothetical protein
MTGRGYFFSYILLALVISAALLTGCSRGPAADSATGFVNSDKVRKIVELGSEKDLDPLVKELKSTRVIPLKSGRYIVAVDQVEESMLEQKLAAGQDRHCGDDEGPGPGA